MRTFFPDRYFGELIFLVKEGAVVPSHRANGHSRQHGIIN